MLAEVDQAKSPLPGSAAKLGQAHHGWLGGAPRLPAILYGHLTNLRGTPCNAAVEISRPGPRTVIYDPLRPQGTRFLPQNWTLYNVRRTTRKSKPC